MSRGWIKYVVGAIFGVVVAAGCTAVASTGDSPTTTLECSGWAGGCGEVFWVERDGVQCAVAWNNTNGASGIDCDWRNREAPSE